MKQQMVNSVIRVYFECYSKATLRIKSIKTDCSSVRCCSSNLVHKMTRSILILPGLGACPRIFSDCLNNLPLAIYIPWWRERHYESKFSRARTQRNLKTQPPQQELEPRTSMAQSTPLRFRLNINTF